MKKNYKSLQFSTLLILFCLAASSLRANNDVPFQNSVNLALRQTAHLLLLEQKDSSTYIPPIEYDGINSFLLRLDNVFNYDTLPSILAQAFEDYNIVAPYEVIVVNAETDLPYLGYNQAALDNRIIPCRGRSEIDYCANIVVHFPIQTPPAQQKLAALGWWLFIPLMLGLLLFVFKKVRLKSNTTPKDQLALGAYYFDHKNQLLLKGEEKITLTFRENKLLHLFASQPNEVLTRSEISSLIWEDEGVIVGRSLDVFISRLRKLLKQDPAVQIKNIHGVGYRLEIPS